MTEPIEIINRWNYKAIVSYDDYSYEDSPRDWVNATKLCIKPHRHYVFPNELKIDWDDEEQMVDIEKGYRVYTIDCYEHGGISFSIHWEGIQCRWDTSNNCWFIAVPRKDCELETEARERARQDLNEYNQWLSWDIYRWEIYRTDEWINKTTWESKEDDTYIEWCGYFLDIEECRKDALDQIRNFIS